ncbi:MAG: class I SAM-dependent methyltransferase [Candidatus Thermoplasmatota archaeon]|nr:class I SAM-dependent methyltransferase [Candidatus Thermoplasmatota archaeon]
MHRLVLKEDKQLQELEGIAVHPGEGQHLAWLASRVKSEHAIVELGSYKGKSACYLGAGSRAGCGAHVYAVDLWDKGETTIERARRPGVLENWKMQVGKMKLNNIIHFIQGHSVETAKTWEKPVGLLFHDAGHSYEEVRADFEAWGKFIVIGGWIAFHDYAHKEWKKQIKPFIDELRDTDEWGEFTLYNWTCSLRKLT